MSEEAKDIWKRISIVAGLLTMASGVIWATAQRDSDLTHIEWRATLSEVRLTEHERDLSDIKGDLKVIKDALIRIEKRMP